MLKKCDRKCNNNHESKWDDTHNHRYLQNYKVDTRYYNLSAKSNLLLLYVVDLERSGALFQ